VSLDAWVHRWWAGETGAAGHALRIALAPAEAAFRAGVALRNRGYDAGWLRSERVDVPVISVGNVAVGGAGKTPFAAWLGARLREWGRRPAIVLRGYGEDEIIVHRELNPDIPVFRGARRIDPAREAVAAGCDVLVLDDAFQHRALARDLDLVLVAVDGWSTRPRVLPRGPWREGTQALGRADLIVLTRKSAGAAQAREVAAEVSRLHPGKPIVQVALRPVGLVPLGGGARMPLDALAGRSIVAIAALATPGPYVQHLREAGAEMEPALYPDHHAFSARDVAEIVKRSAGRWMVMTHKDAVKLRLLLPDSTRAYVLEQSVAIESEADVLDAALRRVVRERAR
jgi:tetraacyldisaccharide 4'-kinase